MNALMTLLRLPDLSAQLGLARDAEAFVRLHFLYAASIAGILGRLGSWTSRGELARQINAAHVDVLDALLEVGVALRELARDGDHFRICGKRSAALAKGRGDALSAVIEECVTYHAAVYRDFPKRLCNGLAGDYLTGKGEMVARSSRVLEPFMVEFVRQRVAGKGAVRMLEIGCGSGVYLRHAAEANPAATGLGIDIQEGVVRETSARLVEWGLDGRFDVLRADIRKPAPELVGPFDLITLYNNIYYFAPEERVALLDGLRKRLRPGGSLALTSMFQAGTTAAANFDLVLRSTCGCSAMGTLGQLVEQLHESRYANVVTDRLIPGQPFYAVTAKNPGP